MCQYNKKSIIKTFIVSSTVIVADSVCVCVPPISLMKLHNFKLIITMFSSFHYYYGLLRLQTTYIEYPHIPKEENRLSSSSFNKIICIIDIIEIIEIIIMAKMKWMKYK